MDLLKCDEKIIKIINNWSNSGNLISATDPNMLDYSLRFRALQDTAQKLIATIKKIRKEQAVTIATVDSTYTEVTLPSNYYKPNKVTKDYEKVSCKYVSRNKIAVLSELIPVTVHYYAYPQDITEATLVTYEFEIDIEAQEAIPYYVAAHMLMDESNLYATLLGIYNNIIANLDDNIESGTETVQTVYYM